MDDTYATFADSRRKKMELTDHVWQQSEQLTVDGDPTTVAEIAGRLNEPEDAVGNAVFTLSREGFLLVDDAFILGVKHK